MQTQIIVGRFLKSDGTPVEGEIVFLPDKLWTIEYGIAMATLAPRVQLEDGRFEAEVTPGHYTVVCPLGEWRVKITASDEPTFLADHLPSRFQ